MLEASDYPCYTVFYQETIDWLPVFDGYYCEGQYNADQEFMVLVIHDNQLLVAQNDKFDCFYIVGGGIHESRSVDFIVCT